MLVLTDSDALIELDTRYFHALRWLICDNSIQLTRCCSCFVPADTEALIEARMLFCQACAAILVT